MPSHSNWVAVSVLRGSITRTRPPRLTISCMRSLMRGAVRKLPWETTGLAPMRTRRSVRVRSGIGTDVGVPYSNWLAISRLLVSWDEAVK